MHRLRVGSQAMPPCTARRLTALAGTSAAALLFSSSWAPSASAASSARLVYVRGPGAESCPGEAAVRAAVRARLGYDPFFAWTPDTLYADVEREGGAYRAIVKVIDADNRQRGAREITVEGADCTPVIDAVGLTVSLALDPSSVLGSRPRPDPSPKPAPDSTAPQATTMPAPPPSPGEPATAPTERRPVLPAGRKETALQAGVSVLAAIGSAPSLAAGGTIAVGASWRRLSLDVEGRGDFPATGPGRSTEVRMWLIAGALVPCVHVGFAFVCPVLTAGAVGATAPNVARPTESYGPWAAVGGRLGVAWDVAPRLTLAARVEALATLVRDTLSVDEAPQFDVPPWSGDLGAAASWRFR